MRRPSPRAEIDLHTSAVYSPLVSESSHLWHQGVQGAFLVLAVVVLMNVLETLLVDMFSATTDKARSLWCARQAAMIMEQEHADRRQFMLNSSEGSNIRSIGGEATTTTAASANDDEVADLAGRGRPPSIFRRAPARRGRAPSAAARRSGC